MRFDYRTSAIGLWILVVMTLVTAGCGKPQPHRAQRGHSHGEWWCDLHGLPEEECSLCSKKVANECKSKGDWCETHKRAMSHCFICKPELKETFAAKYRAKYDGKDPPAIKEFQK